MQKYQNRSIQVKLHPEMEKNEQDSHLQNGIGNSWNFKSQSDEPILSNTENIKIDEMEEQPQQSIEGGFFRYDQDQNEEDIPIFYEQKLPDKKIISKKAIALNYFLPIISALIIGSSLGFGALHLLEDQNKKQNQVETPVKETINNKEDDSVAVTAGASAYDRKLTVSLIQAGVFSTKEAAEKQQSTLPASAPSVILEVNQKYTIFIGLTDTLEHAKKHALDYQKVNIDAFWKDVSFDGQTKSTFSKKEIEKLKIMAQNFLELRAVLSAEKMGEPVMEMHAKEVELEKETGEIAEMIKANNSAIKEFGTYKNSPTTLGLIKYEQKVLDLLKVYKEL